MAMSTPWGPAQTQKSIARGIIQVTTASHGGIHLSPTLNAKMHEAWRDRQGWYEEDCEWAFVALTFPQHFKPELVEMAPRIAKDHYPDKYEAVFGVKVTADESHVRADQAFRVANAERWVVDAAWGYRNDRRGRVPVPEGMVGVVARRPGDGGAGDERWYLVPEVEYDGRHAGGTGNFATYKGKGSRRFVIDEGRHQPWPARNLCPGGMKLVNRIGRDTPVSGGRAQMLTCPDCAAVPGTYESTNGLRYRDHDPKPSALDGIRGELRAICGSEKAAAGIVNLVVPRFVHEASELHNTGRRPVDMPDAPGEDLPDQVGEEHKPALGVITFALCRVVRAAGGPESPDVGLPMLYAAQMVLHAVKQRCVRDEGQRVVRHFQQYTSEPRATRAASHRLGPGQKRQPGEYFYTHPDVPGKAFSTRSAAAAAGVRAVKDAGDAPQVDLAAQQHAAHPVAEALRQEADRHWPDKDTLICCATVRRNLLKEADRYARLGDEPAAAALCAEGKQYRQSNSTTTWASVRRFLLEHAALWAGDSDRWHVGNCQPCDLVQSTQSSPQGTAEAERVVVAVSDPWEAFVAFATGDER